MKKQFLALYKYKNLLVKMVSRDLKVRYRKSYLGIIWTILNPLLMMIIMTLVFSNIFKMTIENFAVYVLIGNVIFTFFSDTTSQALFSILNNSSLIKKIYLPKYIFPISKALSCLINLFFSIIALLVVMIFTQTAFNWSILLFPLPLIYLFTFTCGVSLIVSSLNVFFRDLGHLYSVILTAWMYFTPIFYSVDILPEYMKNMMAFNPLYRFINYFRLIIIDGIIPGICENLICFSFSFIVLMIGIIVFKKLQNKFILYI